jgi:hypothetical protein
MKKDIQSKTQNFEVFAIELADVKVLASDSLESAILSTAPELLGKIGIKYDKNPLPLNVLSKEPYPHHFNKESYYITANFPPVEREFGFIVVIDP